MENLSRILGARLPLMQRIQEAAQKEAWLGLSTEDAKALEAFFVLVQEASDTQPLEEAQKRLAWALEVLKAAP